MSIFNINFSARDNLRVAAGAGDEARPLERENVDIGAGWAGQRTGRWSRRSAHIVTEKVARLQTWERCLTMIGIQYSEEAPAYHTNIFI